MGDMDHNIDNSRGRSTSSDEHGIAPAASSQSSGRKTKRNSDLRKQQNRVASRVYSAFPVALPKSFTLLLDQLLTLISGEKRKQRLALLEQLLDPSRETSTESPSASNSVTSEVNTAPRPNGDHVAAEASTTSPSAPGFYSTAQLELDQWLDLDHLDEFGSLESATGDESWERPSQPIDGVGEQLLDGGLSMTGLNNSMNPSWASSISSPSLPFTSSTPGVFTLATRSANDSQQVPTSPRDFAALAADMVNFAPHLSVTSESDPSPFEAATPATTANSQSSQTHPPTPVSEALRCFARLTPAQKRQVISFVSGPNALTHEEQDEKQASAAMTRYHSDPERWRNIQDVISSVRLPDVKKNSLTLQGTTFFAAINQNAVAIGTVHNLLVEEDSQSHFTLGFAGTTDLFVLAQAKLMFASVAQDLRPVDSQITVEHHPYLVG